MLSATNITRHRGRMGAEAEALQLNYGTPPRAHSFPLAIARQRGFPGHLMAQPGVVTYRLNNHRPNGQTVTRHSA
jgi:hypothetical protein